MFNINLYDESNPRKKRNTACKPKSQPDLVRITETPDTSDIGYIISLINKYLEHLNGKSYTNLFSVKVTPTKTNCFRVIVFNKEKRNVLIDFFVEKGGKGEYVFNPPLDVKAFTTKSYENRNQSKKIWQRD